MPLPPGQRAVVGLPRFGVNARRLPPTVPDDIGIEVSGELRRRVCLAPSDLLDLPRREVTADLHCVAGWSAIGLQWDGVRFADLFDLAVQPALAEGAEVRYVVFVGADGYRSIVALEDALADDVLIADRLDGEPLTPDHGAPARLVSPAQYAFMSTKHLCRIELYRREPVGYYSPVPAVQRTLRAVRPHRRARVWREERHRHLPAWLTRPVYRLLVPPPAPLAEPPHGSPPPF
jgi:DMSO/TMAO reductase YedYZ molybdopterin-dependent catalytic subunit